MSFSARIMLSWNLIEPDASFKALVDNRITMVKAPPNIVRGRRRRLSK
jgi:hypothetical protein